MQHQVIRTVNVVNATNVAVPVITLIGDAVVQLTVGGTYIELGANCEDDLDADKPATVDNSAVDTDTVGTYTVYYDCTNTALNNAIQVFRTVNVMSTSDNTSPTITLNGRPAVQITINGAYIEEGAVCDDDVDPDKAATVGGDTVDTTMLDTYTVTYDCTDLALNNAMQVIRTVNVVATADDIPPVITLTGDNPLTILTGDTYDDSDITCTDDTDPSPILTPDITVDTSQAATYEVTYSCIDAAGNLAVDLLRTVIVEDTTPPVITLTGDSSVTTSVGISYNDQGASCSDAVDGVIMMDPPTSDVNTSQAGTYSVTYSCTDAADNDAVQVTRTVTVEVGVDATLPVITRTGSSSVTIPIDASYNDQGAICLDNVDGVITPTPINDIDFRQPGQYSVTYSCTDAAGNNAVQVIRTVNVEAGTDTTSPVITLTGSSSVTIHIGASSYNDQGAICLDNVDGAITPTPINDIDFRQPGQYSVTYSCTDAAGNNAVQVIRTVNVGAGTDDTTPPVITRTGSSYVIIPTGSSYSDQGAICLDNVDGAITPTPINDIDTSQIARYSVTYSCTDAAGNNAVEVTRTVDVKVTSSNTPSVIYDTDRSSKKRSSSQNSLVADSDITIDGQNYSIGSGTTTITPRDVMTGQTIDITLAAYTATDITHFTAYFNLQGSDVLYSNSDTYVRYVRGEVEITDPHGFISDASITITEDREQSKKKIVDMAIEFDGEMGLTNMVLYMWNEDRRLTFIRVLDAIDVTADAETRQNSASTAGSSTSARVTPESDVSDDNRSDGWGSQSSINSGIAVIGGDNDDDVQTLSMVRMWSGFASESITDAELLESMGLDNYPAVHIPDWVMTELGALVSNNDVTVKEFRTALVYMLEMLTA